MRVPRRLWPWCDGRRAVRPRESPVRPQLQLRTAGWRSRNTGSPRHRRGAAGRDSRTPLPAPGPSAPAGPLPMQTTGRGGSPAASEGNATFFERGATRSRGQPKATSSPDPQALVRSRNRAGRRASSTSPSATAGLVALLAVAAGAARARRRGAAHAPRHRRPPRSHSVRHTRAAPRLCTVRPAWSTCPGWADAYTMLTNAPSTEPPQ